MTEELNGKKEEVQVTTAQVDAVEKELNTDIDKKIEEATKVVTDKVVEEVDNIKAEAEKLEKELEAIKANQKLEALKAEKLRLLNQSNRQTHVTPSTNPTVTKTEEVKPEDSLDKFSKLSAKDQWEVFEHNMKRL